MVAVRSPQGGPGASQRVRPHPRRWSIVLAGGDGVRLRPYVERRFGDARPKQYCAFSGNRSMLQHTLDRASRICPEAQTVTVVARAHARWADPQLAGHPGTVVRQAINRETAPGLFLPLAWIRARDPGAVVYVLPSDHYVRPADRFCAAVATAGELAERHPDRIVLTGVAPDGPETEYGYIEPGDAFDRIGTVRSVRGFVEKPTRDAAADAIARGAVWNTMVIASTVEALWNAGRATVPAVMDRFDELVRAIDTPTESAALESVYDGMPTANFSKDVLERVVDRLMVTRLDGIEWSDWGQAERIEETLSRQTRRPPRAAPQRIVATAQLG
jgi:mannose-1-phosphate guanylyltransferase